MQTIDQLNIDTPEQICLEFPLAGIGSRFLAIAVDTLLQILLYVLVILILVFFARYVHFPRMPRWADSVIAGLVVLALFCIYWGYYAFFEILWNGKTPGKRVAGIRVIKESGRAINAYEAIGRNLMRAIDWLPGLYAVGVICMITSSQNRRLGDYVAGTLVVHEKRSESAPAWGNSKNDKVHVNSAARITTAELVLIETYLNRRQQLDPAVRDDTAYRIAEKVKIRCGVQRGQDQSLDDFLESIAQQARDQRMS